MIIFITGASHTGKTVLAQKFIEKYKFSCISIDLLKMGLIKSKYTSISVFEDEKLQDYLWPIIFNMAKTAIENNQHLIFEGCYIPMDWKKYFSEDELKEIRFYCLVMSENYIINNFDKIKSYASIIENRLDDTYCTLESTLDENKKYLRLCKENNQKYILIDKDYEENISLWIE